MSKTIVRYEDDLAIEYFLEHFNNNIKMHIKEHNSKEYKEIGDFKDLETAISIALSLEPYELQIRMKQNKK